MPLVPLYPNPLLIDGFHNLLISIYSEWDQPKGIESGVINPGFIDTVCYHVSQDTLYGRDLWMNFFHRAAYLMFNLNRGHPYIDGNKRTSLFATYYF